MDTVQIAKQNDATVIAPFELATYLGWEGCKVHPQAFHGSALTNDEKKTITYLGMPSGILLTIEDKTIYHAGDTGLFSDMKLIGELNKIDLALLPIGDNFTMGPDDALIAAEWLRADKVIPIHYNTFSLIKQDGQKFIEDLKGKGLDGEFLNIEESLEL